MIEFRSAAALRAHYASVHERLWPAASRVPAAKVALKPSLNPARVDAALPAKLQSQWAVNALIQEFSIRYGFDDENVPAIRDILCAVATHYGVTVLDIKSRRRARTVGLPRHVAYYLCKILTGSSLPQIGRHVGGKDHTSVLHGVRKIAARLATDAQLTSDIRAICAMLGRA
jgi:chromosomal replication initiator protein